MLEIDVGQCANLNGTTIRSFSIDDCPPGTIDTTRPGNNATITTGTPPTTIPTDTPTTTSSSSSSTTSAGYTPNMRNNSSPNKTAIIGGAVAGGDRYAKRRNDYATDNNITYTGGGGAADADAGGYGSTIAPDAPAGYSGPGAGGPYRTNFPPVGELEGHPAFWRYGGQYAKPPGAGTSSRFETEAMPMGHIPRQELEASTRFGSMRHNQNNLPEMPRIPAPYA
ncbi:hypothetical protein AA313_de0204308 [Arthrobotrys entomopaga]|nr:hypothetical protein AA313_de0204308 [Arthrobotrys entomopaga]